MGFMSVKEQEKHEKPIDQGHGYKVYEVMTKHGEEKDVVFNHAILAQQVHAAEKYELHHGGMLPQNHFWSVVVPLYEADKSFFKTEHECPELLSVLHHNDNYMLTHMPPPGMIGGGGTLGGGTGINLGGGDTGTMTGGGGGMISNPAAVPEPATIVSMSMGLLMLGFAAWYKKKFPRKKLIPIYVKS